MDAKQRKAAELAQRAAEQKAANKLANFRANLAWNLEAPQGRAFIWDMLQRASILDREFLADPYQRSYRDGQQAYGVFLYIEIMNTNPDAYGKMWAENAKGD